MTDIKISGNSSPYKGLIPYTEEDAPFFFGRNQRCEVISTNLLGSRLTVLHGPSGVGKSSILRAGVAHNLRKLAALNEDGEPEFAVIVFSSWRDDPVVGLAAQVRDSVARLLKREVLDPLPPSGDLSQSLRTWSKVNPEKHRPDLDLLIILDQFEEYFLYHPQESGNGSFAVELPRAVNSSELRVNFLISIRDDALAKLDLFKGDIPQLFENRLSLKHLDRESAREAIVKPIDQYNRIYLAGQEPIRIENTLVEAVLDQIESGQVVIGQAGRGTVETEKHASGAIVPIETPYLQMVMMRLWEEEISAGSRVLRLETLNRLGGAAHIVHTHLDETMSTLTPVEQDAASHMFYQLVTPSGTKIAHTVDDLAAFAKVRRAPLDPMLVNLLSKLSDNPGRILRPVEPPPNQQGVERYEIFHDVLAPAILDWQTRYANAKGQARAERRAAEKAAKKEREAAYLLRVQQAEALAEALRQKAKEERLRFEAERSRAAEQEQRAKSERLRAAEQHERLEEQRVASKRMRRLAMALAVMVLLAVSTAVLAVSRSLAARNAEIFSEDRRQAAERSELRAEHDRLEVIAQKSQVQFERDAAQRAGEQATVEKQTAEAAKAQAEKAQADALTQKSQAESQQRIALAGEIAANATVKLDHDPQLSLLLALEAGKVLPPGKNIEAVSTALREAYFKSYDRSILVGHRGIVWQALFSRDGKSIVTIGDDGSVRMWQPNAAGETKVIWKKTSDYHVHAVDISQDGKLVATEAEDGMAKIWNARTGDLLRTLSGLHGAIAALSFSPDGTKLITETGDLDTKTGEATIWDTRTGEALKTLRGHEEEISAVAFSPNGELVATGSWDKTARIWNAKTGELLVVLKGHSAPISSLAFSPKGESIITSSYDKTAKIWETSTGNLQQTLSGHAGPVHSACFSPDGKWIVTASRRMSKEEIMVTRDVPGVDDEGIATEGTTARIWNVSTGKSVAVLNHEGDVYSAIFSPDSELVVTTSQDGNARIWESASGEKIAELRGHSGPVYNASFSSDNKFVVTASADGTARLWEVPASYRMEKIETDGPIRRASFGPRDGLVTTISTDGVLQTWNLKNPDRSEENLRDDQGHVYDSAISPDRKLFVTASRKPKGGRAFIPSLTNDGDDTIARVWDKENRLVRELKGHDRAVDSIVFSRDGKFIVTGSADGTAILWDTATGKSVRRLGKMGTPGKNNYDSIVSSVAISPDNSLIATATLGGQTQLWETATGKQRALLPDMAPVLNVAFSTDGKLLATAVADGTAEIWNISDGTNVWNLRGHTGPLWSVAFSPDGRWIVTASHDNTVRVWSMATGETIMVMRRHSRPVFGASFGSDNKSVITASNDQTARIFSCETCVTDDELRALAKTRTTRSLTAAEECTYLHTAKACASR